MKTILLATLLYFFSGVQTPQSNVYICDSPSAKKFHLVNKCNGLNRCSHEIKEMSKAEAISKGYSICLMED